MPTEASHSESSADKSIDQAISELLRDGPEMLDKIEKSAFPKNIEFILNHFSKGTFKL